MGSGVRYVFRGKENVKRVDTMTWSSTQDNLCSDVDWVFTTLHTPWSTRYIPEKVYKHIDINCDLMVSQQINNDNKYILYHAEIPGDGRLKVPSDRNYLKLHSVEYSSVNVWLTDKTGAYITSLPNEKTRLTLHLRKKKSLQSM